MVPLENVLLAVGARISVPVLAGPRVSDDAPPPMTSVIVVVLLTVSVLAPVSVTLPPPSVRGLTFPPVVVPPNVTAALLANVTGLASVTAAPASNVELLFDATLADVSGAREVAELVDVGGLRSLSIGARATLSRRDGDVIVRVLAELDEVSVVGFGALKDAAILSLD